ncbi:hypothetical protein INT48_009032 [Thamnidium elegans]|uniref:Uncharacterized protein n=1 Tax=Thamnidium elegans TaxID=101142 RepID=A0A8H7SUK0_9FUNG|nr:hypothetical protein INT48_009032 [Thamnidium elegans]
MAIIFANENSSRINLSALFVIRGIQYAFAFHTMLYAFYRNIVRVNGEDKYLVNIGYIWMFVTLGVSLAATLMTNNISWRFYDIRDFKNIYNVVAVTMLSSWGFIAIIILLYIKNRQHFSVDSETTVIIYIFLVLIQTITTTVTMYRYAGNDDIRSAFDFFLIDLPMDIAIIIAAHRGPVRIGDANINSKSGDLEVNHGSN